MASEMIKKSDAVLERVGEAAVDAALWLPDKYLEARDARAERKAAEANEEFSITVYLVKKFFKWSILAFVISFLIGSTGMSQDFLGLMITGYFLAVPVWCVYHILRAGAGIGRSAGRAAGRNLADSLCPEEPTYWDQEGNRLHPRRRL